MTPPPTDTVAGMIRPVPMPPESRTNRDLLAVMKGASGGYWFLLGLALAVPRHELTRLPMPSTG